MSESLVPITERTFEFAVRIVKLCQVLEEQSSMSRPLARQLIRSGTSIGANVEESQAAESRADFIHKLSIALKEVRETRYWLKLLVATEVMPAARLEALIQESEELMKIIAKIVVRTKQRNN